MVSKSEGASPEASVLARGVRRIERATSLDGLATSVEHLVRPISEGTAGAALRGDWYGHAIHPPLTDVALGCWLSAGVLDVFGGDKSQAAARTLVGAGLLAAVPTALSGAAEWRSLTDRLSRRVALVHATGNGAVILCYLASWILRRSRKQRAGVAWGLAGAGLGLFTGYLGGHLAFGHGIGHGQRWASYQDVMADIPAGRTENESGDKP